MKLTQLAGFLAIPGIALSLAACTSATVERQANPVGILDSIPLPTFAPMDAKASSRTDYTLLGEDYNPSEASNRITPGPGTALTLTPNFGAVPGGLTMADLAFAVYTFPTMYNFPNGGMFSTSYLPSMPGLTWIGVSDYTAGVWRWFELPADGRINLPDLNSYFFEGGIIHCAFVQLGVSNDAVIDWVRFGPTTPEIDADFWPVPVPITLSDGVSELLMVDGKPAFAAVVDDSGVASMTFNRASNPEGTAWDNWEYIDNAGWGTPSLADVGGMPAVAYGGASPGVSYCRATDASGSTWGISAIIDSTGIWSEGVLFMVDGNPAIAYIGADNTVRFIRSLDSTGTSWPPGSAYLHGGSVDFRYSNIAARVIGGVAQIAVEWIDLSTSKLRVLHFCAFDVTASAWEPSTTVFTCDYSANGIHNLNLLELNSGIPGVGWFLEDYNFPEDSTGYFAVANDSAGSSWGTPEPMFEGFPVPPFPLIVKFAAFDTVTINSDRYLAASGITMNSIGVQRSEALFWPISAAGTIDFNGLRGHTHINFVPTLPPASAGKGMSALKGVSTFESWSDLESMAITDPFGYILLYILCYGYMPDFSPQLFWSRPQIIPTNDVAWATSE